MGELTHKAARAAFGTAIGAALKHVNKDREKGLLQRRNIWGIPFRKKPMTRSGR